MLAGRARAGNNRAPLQLSYWTHNFPPANTLNKRLIADYMRRHPGVHIIWGLAQFLSNYGDAWTLFMAACVLATIPLLVVFIVLQRGFLQAFSDLSGIKG